MNKTLTITQGVQERAPLSARRALPFEWKWVVLVCLLLGVSGGFRWWRDSKFQSLTKEGEVSPFALKEFPRDLGNWHSLPGSESTLEPDIVRIAGATDHLLRAYVDEKSGMRAEVLILYGLATGVWPHTPEVCYPATGFHPLVPSRDHDMDVRVADPPTAARFRVQHFVRSDAGQVDSREVYYSFKNAGRWGLDMGRNWKSFRYHPGMYKIQVQRPYPLGGDSDESAVQDLLGQIVREIEQRSAARS